MQPTKVSRPNSKRRSKICKRKPKYRSSRYRILKYSSKGSRKYITIKEFTPYALRELVKGIYVEASDKSSGKRKQKTHIGYDLVGYIPVDELMKAEQA
jgi:tnpX site-specific recombinase